MLPRRLLLAAPAVMLAARARGAGLLEPDEGGRAVWHDEAAAGGIALPAKARLVGRPVLAGRNVAALGFVAATQTGRLDLLALAAPINGAMRLVALEVLAWAGPDGARLFTRFAATPDQRTLRLARDAMLPGVGRESWTDYLAWHDGAAMDDAPVRLPLPTSLQARLRPYRLACLAWLAAPRTDVAQAPQIADPLAGYAPSGGI